MIKLFSDETYSIAKSRDLLPIECEHCHSTFYLTKNKIQSNIRNNRTHTYCSTRCLINSKNKPMEVQCLQCGKHFIKSVAAIKSSPNHFCSHSCAATYNNHAKKGAKRQGESLINIQNSNAKRRRIQPPPPKQSNIIQYYANANVCAECGQILEYNKRNNFCCSVKCRKIYDAKNKNEFLIYKSLTNFNFNISKYEELNFDLIKQFGWYKPTNRGNNIKGVSRDHMFSVKEGFRRLINPLLLAHPANCQLLLHYDNSSKHDKCTITLGELKEKIFIFDKKYGQYYTEPLNDFVTIQEVKELYTKVKYVEIDKGFEPLANSRE